MNKEINNLYLVRGLPGSGKTTFVESVKQEGDMVVAADNFMVDGDGNYTFDWRRLDEVHRKCHSAVEDAMRSGTRRIWVHNTFVEAREIEPYKKLAERHGYRVHAVIAENRHGSKNLHKVADGSLQKKREKFDIAL